MGILVGDFEFGVDFLNVQHTIEDELHYKEETKEGGYVSFSKFERNLSRKAHTYRNASLVVTRFLEVIFDKFEVSGTRLVEPFHIALSLDGDLALLLFDGEVSVATDNVLLLLGNLEFNTFAALLRANVEMNFVQFESSKLSSTPKLSVL